MTVEHPPIARIVRELGSDGRYRPASPRNRPPSTTDAPKSRTTDSGRSSCRYTPVGSTLLLSTLTGDRDTAAATPYD